MAVAGAAVLSGCSAPSGGVGHNNPLSERPREDCESELPPKEVPQHPRLAPTPTMHFDLYNSSVSDLSAPVPGGMDAHLVSHDLLLGTCLNFLRDGEGHRYGFCSTLTNVLRDVSFTVTSFDGRLEKRDEYEIVRFRRKRIQDGDLPLNLGYFVMDDHGRVIVATNETGVEFLKENDTNEIEAVMAWNLGVQLEERLPEGIAAQPIAQVVPSYDRGYWIMALGDRDENLPAYLGRVSDSATLEDVHVFEGETIGNGMAVDDSGAYVVTDHALYKATRGSDTEVKIDWEERYSRSETVKPGTENLSRRGSGSTPTLLGADDDLVAITDNAEDRVNVLVLARESGRVVASQPVFEAGRSANENTLVGYGDSIVAQNWYGAPPFTDEMLGMASGLTRIDVDRDRGASEVVWNSDDRDREFASRPTVRLSTCTGHLFGPIQVAEGDEYAMAFLDFETGEFVETVPFPGSGAGYRVSSIPPSITPSGRLIQPVRRGYVVFQN